MNRNRIIITIGAMALLLAAGVPVSGQEAATNAAPRFDARSFQVISQRNIFNPNRRAFRPEAPRIQIQTATLNGTMSYEDQSYAFFGNRTVKPSDKIGDYKVAEITNNAVKLMDTSNQVFNLIVGMQLRKEGDGPWKVVGSGSDMSTTPSSSGTSDQTNETTSSTTTTYKGADEDVVKKLMAKRLAEEKGTTENAPDK
jgi:hypothetical protein